MKTHGTCPLANPAHYQAQRFEKVPRPHKTLSPDAIVNGLLPAISFHGYLEGTTILDFKLAPKCCMLNRFHLYDHCENEQAIPKPPASPKQ